MNQNGRGRPETSERVALRMRARGDTGTRTVIQSPGRGNACVRGVSGRLVAPSPLVHNAAVIRPLDASARRDDRRRWNRRARAWERWEPVFQHALAAVNPALLRALELRPGMRVLDVGCGAGDPALEIAAWVRPRGRVVGIDIAAPMLATARRRARLLGLTNAQFRRADLASLRLRGRFDALAARFSLMFAADVGEALEQMRAALRPGGRAAIAVWAPLSANPGSRLRDEAVRPFLREPPPDPESSPHPLRLGRPGLLPRLMRGAGFTSVTVQPVRVLWVYPSLDDYVRMQIDSSLADLWQTLSARDRARLSERLRRGMARYASDGPLRYPGKAWVVSGRA